MKRSNTRNDRGQYKVIHGHWCLGKPTPTYKAWERMKRRCRERPTYVGRGICVCSDWENSFENFLRDMGCKPPGLTLGRIDNNIGYCKSNCRWETWQQQERNRSNTRLKAENIPEIFHMKNEGFTRKQIAAHFGVSYTTIEDVLLKRTWKGGY